MTLPTDINLPFNPEEFASDDPKRISEYMHKLTDALTDMYQQIAQNVNGYIKAWSPIAYGDSVAGTGTYTTQSGWIRRSGILTELWFDLEWTTHTGSGSLIIELPYVTANSVGAPWVGVIQSISSSNTFSSGYTYLVWNAIPDTTQGPIFQCGSGKFNTPITVDDNQGFAGYIQYLGQENENVNNF